MSRSYNYFLHIFYLFLLFLLVRDCFILFLAIPGVDSELGGVSWVVIEWGEGGFPQFRNFVDLRLWVDVLR